MTRTPWTSDLHWVRKGQQTRSQKTQQALLDAAEALFAANGIEATSVNDIARHADSSIGALYHHFRDKKALLYALYDRYSAELDATTQEAIDPARWEGAGIADVLRGYLTFALETERRRPGVRQVGAEAARDDPELRAHFNKLRSRMHDGLTRLLAARRDEIGHPDPELAISFALEQLFAMIRYRRDRRNHPGPLARRSDKVFIEEAVTSAAAYLQLRPER